MKADWTLQIQFKRYKDTNTNFKKVFEKNGKTLPYQLALHTTA